MVTWNPAPGPIVGVVNDFHFQSLHHTIRPLVYEFTPELYEYLLVKIKPGNTTTAIKNIERAWKELLGDMPFDYSFLDKEYAQLYATTKDIIRLLTYDFRIPLLISLLLALSVGYYSMVRWLEEFSYKTELNIWIFVAAGLVNVVLAYITLSYQAIRVAH